MSLSISDTNHLSAPEVKSIANCDFATEVLALQMNAEGGPKFVTISRKQLTCWQFFLKFFRMGNLANMEFGLDKVAAHCNKYKWSDATGLSSSSELYQAYVKVCMLANKALYHTRNRALYENVSPNSVEKKVEFAQYRYGSLLNRHDLLQPIRWNPALKVRDVKMFLAREFPNSLVRVEDEGRQALANETNLSLDVLKRINLYVEQRLYVEQPVVVPVPVPLPHAHHHQFAPHNHHYVAVPVRR